MENKVKVELTKVQIDFIVNKMKIVIDEEDSSGNQGSRVSIKAEAIISAMENPIKKGTSK